MKRLVYFIPLLIVLVLGAFFFWGLNPERDPSEIPSALKGRLMPDKILTTLPNYESQDFIPQEIAQDDIALVNFFASWCVPCRAEHKPLAKLAQKHSLPLYGINYKDDASDAKDWLLSLGDSYKAIGFDETGRAGIDWGISGVPETFVLEKGVIRYRHRGPIVGETAIKQFETALKEVK